ncbi:MAG: UDP-N-acetylglucosamine 2-epimerase, partial [Pseudomonadota bacterium]
QALHALSRNYKIPVVVSTHPRTKKRIDENPGLVREGGDIRFLKPFGFHDYNKLQCDCFCALSDSGTISEEASMLGFPAVTIRNSIERPEALDTGSIAITGLETDSILRCVTLVCDAHRDGIRATRPADYSIEDVSERVVRLIAGTAGLSNRWHGISNS